MPDATQPETFTHVAATGMGGKTIAAEVCTLKQAAHNFAERDDANELTGGAENDEIGLIRRPR